MTSFRLQHQNHAHQQLPGVGGIHLSGPNAGKTALVILHGAPLTDPLQVSRVYEKIGSFGTLFSDDRLIEIINLEGPLREIFIDCPLTTPPCVACERPACPGVVQCDDLGVAYLLAASAKHKKLRKAKKTRPINPQSQRLWDIVHGQKTDASSEPSYSANMAPLVTRARVLQRRLNSLTPVIALRETSPPLVLETMVHALGLSNEVRQRYRNFEMGREEREKILGSLFKRHWLAKDIELDSYDSLVNSVEVFHAFITALTASFFAHGLTTAPPQDYLPEGGWVYTPSLSSALPEAPKTPFGMGH